MVSLLFYVQALSQESPELVSVNLRISEDLAQKPTAHRFAFMKRNYRSTSIRMLQIGMRASLSKHFKTGLRESLQNGFAIESR
jgi:hypothetical protein